MDITVYTMYLGNPVTFQLTVNMTLEDESTVGVTVLESYLLFQ